MNGFVQNVKDGFPYMSAGGFSAKHAFTTRDGGVSGGIFASLNLGENRGDLEENVRENYRRLCAALEISEFSLVRARQVHGDTVLQAKLSHRRGLFEPIPWEADALVTTEKGLALMVFTADCVPVLICGGGAVAAVHCGWRSTAQDIVTKTVREMEKLGADPVGMEAAIGPAIGACCFETGPEVPEQMRELFDDFPEDLAVPHPERDGKFFVDLRGIILRQFVNLGLSREKITVSDECTYCENHKYWSHRKTSGLRGSQAAVVIC